MKEFVKSKTIRTLLTVCCITVIFHMSSCSADPERIDSGNNENEDIILAFSFFANKDNTISIKVPIEDTLSDYNTFYGNLIISKLVEGYVNEELISEINKMVGQEGYMEINENQIFEGVEKLYHFDILLEQMDSKYTHKRTNEQIEYLMDSHLHKEFFIDEYTYLRMSKHSEESEELYSAKLSHTMQTLKLLKRYDFLENIDKIGMASWLEKMEGKTEKIIDKLYITRSLEILGFKKNVANIELYDGYNMKIFADILELESYLLLSSEYGLEKDEKIVNEYLNQIHEEMEYINISDLQKIYRYLSIIKMSGNTVEKNMKDEILSLLEIYKYDNGLFPVITEFVPCFKQKLIYSVTMDALDIDYNFKYLDYSGAYYDAFDVYAGARLRNTPLLEAKEILDRLSVFSGGTVTQFAYYINALIEMGQKIDKKDLPENFVHHYKTIIENPKHIPGIDDLILLDALLSAKIIDTKEIEFDIQSIPIENNEVELLSLYYKYKILLDHNNPVDTDKLFGKIYEFRCEGGYKANRNNSFFDPFITSLILELKNK